MRSKTLKETLKKLYATKERRAVVIEGPPGGGKTTIAKEVAQELGIPCIIRHLPTMPVEDFGVPDLLSPAPSGAGFGYRLPDWFPTGPAAPPVGILCFDDRNQASPDLQKVLANIIQERSLHGHRLPDGWMVISTGNRKEDKAGVGQILSHLDNRETRLTLDTHIDDWRVWACDHGVNPLIVAFLMRRPELLHKFDAAERGNPTPRSWVEGVSPIIGLLNDDAAELEVIQGAIGTGAASEFVAYARTWRSLPDVDVLLADPETSLLPTDPHIQYVVSSMLAHYSNKTNFDKVCRYLSRLPAEFSVLSVTLAVRRDPALTTTPAFRDWSVANKETLF